MVLIRFVLMFVVMVLAGCAAPGISKEDVVGKDPTKGLVVVSVTYAGSFSKHWIGLEKSDGTNATTLTFPTGMPVFPLNLMIPKSDISSKELEGNVYVLELPAGEYLLKKWSANQPGRDVSSRNPVNLPFPVVAGKITYLGNVYFDFEWRKDKEVLYNVKLQDESNRDLPLARSKFPQLGNKVVDINLPKGYRIEYLGIDPATLTKYPRFEMPSSI